MPAAAFEAAVTQIPARRWLGLTATPYRRDRLDVLIGLLVGPTRRTFEATTTSVTNRSSPGSAEQLSLRDDASPPVPVLSVHPTGFLFSGSVDPSVPGGINAVYKEFLADAARNEQIVGDVHDAIGSTSPIFSASSHLSRLRLPEPCPRSASPIRPPPA